MTWPTRSSPSGAFSDIAPRLNLDWAGRPAWGDAGVIVPWTLYRMYGDTAILHRHFAAMTAWMDFLERGNPDYLRSRALGNSYNDWLTPGADDDSLGFTLTEAEMAALAGLDRGEERPWTRICGSSTLLGRDGPRLVRGRSSAAGRGCGRPGPGRGEAARRHGGPSRRPPGPPGRPRARSGPVPG